MAALHAIRPPPPPIPCGPLTATPSHFFYWWRQVYFPSSEIIVLIPFLKVGHFLSQKYPLFPTFHWRFLSFFRQSSFFLLPNAQSFLYCLRDRILSGLLDTCFPFPPPSRFPPFLRWISLIDQIPECPISYRSPFCV